MAAPVKLVTVPPLSTSATPTNGQPPLPLAEPPFLPAALSPSLARAAGAATTRAERSTQGAIHRMGRGYREGAGAGNGRLVGWRAAGPYRGIGRYLLEGYIDGARTGR